MNCLPLILASAAVLGAVPASATITIVEGNVPGSLPTVHLVDNASPTVVNGTVAGPGAVDVGVLITGTEAIAPSSDGNGQTWVAATDGGLDAATFTLASGYSFGAIEFNLNTFNGRPYDYIATISGVDQFGTLFTHDYSLSGGSFFNLFASNGEVMTSASFSTTEDILAVGQIRIGDVALLLTPDQQSAVPEPASWAMMVAGFGLLGAAMRRRPAKLQFRMS